MEEGDSSKPVKSKAELKRERRELQEAQRAAKMAAKAAKQTGTQLTQSSSGPKDNQPNSNKSQNQVFPKVDQSTKSKSSSQHDESSPKPRCTSLRSTSSTKDVSLKGPISEVPEQSPSNKPQTGMAGTPTTGTAPGSASASALGVMRMDDPAHLKKSLRQLHRKKLVPRPQDPVRVNLFCHLSQPDKRVNVLTNLKLGVASPIHPAFLRLGLELDESRIVGSNKRCVEFIRAMVALVLDFDWKEAPGVEGGLARAFHVYFDRHVTFLDQCRPLPVSVRSAVQYIKIVLHRLDNEKSPDEMSSQLLEALGSFMENQVHLVDEEIAKLASDQVPVGGVVCVFGESTVVANALKTAWEKKHKNFTVLVVDCRPRHEGRRMFQRLRKIGIPCELVHIAALPMVAPKVSLTLLGAHSLLSNGYIISSMGTAHVANTISSVAHTPVMVCAETYKFWERAQSDAFEFNELGDPDDIWRGPRGASSDWRVPMDPSLVVAPETHPENWRDLSQRSEGRKNLRLLNLTYDLIPPTLVSAVITELGVLPTTSVPVVLRVKRASIEESECIVSPLSPF